MVEEATPGQPTITRAQFKKAVQAQLRAARPGLGAISRDAAAFCRGRGEPWPTTRWGRWLTVIRLVWQADDFLALALYRLRTVMLDAPFPVPILPKLLHILSAQLSDIRIGDWTVLEAGIYIPHGHIVIDGLVKVGHGSVLRPWITLGLVHGGIVGPTLAERVSVGTGAKILGDVKIGAFAKIGANAVVISDVPAGATAIGVPARVIENGSTAK